jgi:5-methylcytosine-specific restriction endonuclease McrA
MPRLRTLPSRLASLPSRVAIVQPGSWRADKTSSAARGYGYAWQMARAEHLLAHPFCAYCLRDAGIEATSIEGVVLECAAKRVCVPRATLVDHMDPHRGDMALFWDRSRWQSLCTNHHSGEKQRHEAAAPKAI